MSTGTLTTDTLLQQLVRQITCGYHWIAIGRVPWRMTCRALDAAMAERYGHPRYFRCRRLFALVATSSLPVSLQLSSIYFALPSAAPQMAGSLPNKRPSSEPKGARLASLTCRNVAASLPPELPDNEGLYK